MRIYKGLNEPGEEVACALILHWGVNHHGELALKRHGRPSCERLEAEAEEGVR